jgi:hypothetical protein
MLLKAFDPYIYNIATIFLKKKKLKKATNKSISFLYSK